MRARLLVLILCLSLTLSACTRQGPAPTQGPVETAQPTDTPALPSETPEPPSETPEPTLTPATPSAAPVQSSPTPDLLAEYRAYIENSIAIIEQVPREGYSALTYPFEADYAYTSPPADIMELYYNGEDYAEPQRALFDEICALVVSSMPEDYSAYDKYRYLAYFVCFCTSYDLNGSEGDMSLTPYGAVMGHESVCLGFAYLYLYLCEQADLWCEVQIGEARHNGELHGWNRVRLEEGYFYVDTTWADSADLSRLSWFDNFMVDEATFFLDHQLS